MGYNELAALRDALEANGTLRRIRGSLQSAALQALQDPVRPQLELETLEKRH